MPVPVLISRTWPLLALAGLVSLAPDAHAQRVSARDKVKVDALQQRMTAAEKRYSDALLLVANADPKGSNEADAALEDMEDVISECVKQKGCQMSNMLATYKRLLKRDADAAAEDEGGELPAERLEADPDHIGPLTADVPEAARAAALLNDKRHAFDNMVEYNPAVQAGIRRWLTDMRPALLTSYENYQNLRAVMWPEWEKRGLPEALLFGIMAKESNGRVHASSRAGAAGLMQFMPATGRRFGLGPDGTGFDTRFDAHSAAEASATYLNERMRELNNNIELSLAGYNGGEGRALRVARENPGQSFWVDRVYNQFPGETKDYVPMVIAAAWIFLHPQQYGVEFPKISAQPATLRLARSTTIYELTICLGSHGTRDGYMRALRNLNPRYEADGWIPAGTLINATTRIASLYQRNCVSGPRADLARTLITADLNAAIVRPSAASYTGSVAVGGVVPVADAASSTSVPTAPVAAVAAPRPAPAARPKPARSYKVGRGETLGRIAAKFQCDVPTLARANGLKAPAYSLRHGQVLKLQGCEK
ncbi:transglycosylase SLT domain-containing protein [Stenotrophomonas maltophilia]|jgi:membrane-bound lytic murein transglycosylase D|uniref:Lytic transglycosylase n=1 Tax=Stenotrophomonas maltophilia TaxID=40324 RepID=A0AAP7GT11_STEMA|nr:MULTISPECIES: transglycosylase SLT domain-containing protein [Stenotrophomonas]MBE5270005.1 transglycosylase SLT domain-containing protein [Stenotrophomonas sp. B2]MBH1835386.1 transglycosylase SLT domain-containing protein [Stenotrophomonas maltophilia]MCO7398215.1 transglycosylase SLT domain-containing protein [Stenotrophomonas maltophilia]MCO7411416.1 transglycosylase SLT domain-containing protein [Stenotrophomonas maltophilia]MCU1021383.1 transglycosylase SLT domain-containing protein [